MTPDPGSAPSGSAGGSADRPPERFDPAAAGGDGSASGAATSGGAGRSGAASGAGGGAGSSGAASGAGGGAGGDGAGTERFDPGKDEMPPVQQVPTKERIPFRVFILTTEIVILTLLMFFVLLLWNSDFERFGAAAVGPVLTVFAGATGFYFGNRGSKDDD